MRKFVSYSIATVLVAALVGGLLFCPNVLIDALFVILGVVVFGSLVRVLGVDIDTAFGHIWRGK